MPSSIVAVAHAVAGAALAQVVRHHRHVLGAAGDDDLGVAGLDPAGGGVDRLEAGAADAVDGVGGHLDGQAGLDGGVARDVAVLHDLADAAEDDLVDLLALDAGALDGLPDDGGAEVGGRGVGEAALEPADGGAHAADDDNVFHLMIPPQDCRKSGAGVMGIIGTVDEGSLGNAMLDQEFGDRY